MKVLIALTYFRPYKSGLTVYAQRLAKTLAERGHEVIVLTSQHERSLPIEETVDDVHIIRMPVAFRLSKGVIMPSVFFKAWKLTAWADVINLHVPQVDAALISLVAKIKRKPVVLTYQCDLKMPRGWINQLAGFTASIAHHISATLADVIVHITRDFAEHSAFLRKYLTKVEVIPTPIIVKKVTNKEINAFKAAYAIEDDQAIIGIATRLAAEKGVEYLVGAMPTVLTAYPKARVLCIGEYRKVFGEEAYRKKMLPLIETLGNHWTFLGVVSDSEKAAFFQVCRLLVLPSINSTESFGMVQIEAMACGTPVVATNLPGVRQAVKQSGMGHIVPPQDSEALAAAIISLLKEPKPKLDVEEIIKHYAPETIAKQYEEIFAGLLNSN